MKKLFKLYAIFAGIICLIAAVNALIFKFAGIPTRTQFECFKYKWRHGRLNYVVSGKGEPVLLIHGLNAGCSHMEWKELQESLSQNYRVYALDFLGYGESSKPNITYSAYLFASQINAFINDVISSPVNVVASSGGSIAAVAACALKPELYNKMLLVSPIGIHNEKYSNRGRAIQSLINMPVIGTAIYNLITSHIYFRCSLIKNLGLPLGSPKEMYRSAHDGGVGNKYPVSACFSDMMNFQYDYIIPKISLPIHVCWGARNMTNPLSNFRTIRRKNDSIALSVFGNSGAYPHKNQPKKFYRLCRCFFG